MPYKSGSLKGKLNASEIRTLIKAHNVLNTIKIPKGAKRDDLIKLVEGKGYSINHENQSISRKIKKATEIITLPYANKLSKSKPLTEEEKKKRQQAKQKKEGQKAFLKKAIPSPPPVSKPSKSIKVGKPPPKKSSKEDEVRAARKAAPPIPKAKDFVKIGGRPAGQRVDTSGSRNVAKVVDAPKAKDFVKIGGRPAGQRVDTSGSRNVGKVVEAPKKPKGKTLEEKKAASVERKKLGEIRQGINRIRDVKYIRDIIEQWNNTERGQKLAKSRGKPIRTTEGIMILKQKIIANEMYKDINIKIPPKKERKKMTEEEKKQKAKEKKEKEKLQKTIVDIILKWKEEFQKRKRDGEDEKDLLEELEDRWDDLVEKHEDDAFDDDDFLDEMEKIKDTIRKYIEGKGLKGKEFAESVADSKDFKEGFKKK